MQLNQLVEIGMKTVVVIKLDGKVISGKITSHFNQENDINKIVSIKVMSMSPNSIPVEVMIEDIEAIEVLGEENYY